MNHTTRTSNLKQMLSNRRRDVLSDTSDAAPDARGDGTRTDLALVQTTSQTSARLDDALAQLDAGKYGSCIDCAREISERRLSAAPFAVRCQTCEERRQEKPGRM